MRIIYDADYDYYENLMCTGAKYLQHFYVAVLRPSAILNWLCLFFCLLCVFFFFIDVFVIVGGDGDDRPNRPEMNKPDWQSPYYGNVLMSMLSN